MSLEFTSLGWPFSFFRRFSKEKKVYVYRPTHMYISSILYIDDMVQNTWFRNNPIRTGNTAEGRVVKRGGEVN